MLDATEENDFENTIEVFLKGTEMVGEAEDRSDRKGVYLGRTSARFKVHRATEIKNIVLNGVI